MPTAPHPPDPCMLCGAAEIRTLFEKSGRQVVRCRTCGLEWAHPMPTAEELAAYYERSYADGTYSFFAEAQEVRGLIARHRLEALRHPHPSPAHRLLEPRQARWDLLAANQAGRSL